MYTLGDVLATGTGFYHTTTRGSLSSIAANIDLVTPTGYTYAGEKSALMPYLSNFISSSAGAGGASIWDRIGGLVTNIGSVFNQPRSLQTPTIIESVTGGAGVGDISTIPPAVPAPRSTGGGMRATIPTAVGTAIVGGVAGMLAPGMVGLGGRHLRYAAPGTKGYHPIKKGPHAGQWARNRRMRVTNVKALRRGLRRLHGFEKICRRVIHFTSPRTRGRAVFKRRRRR